MSAEPGKKWYLVVVTKTSRLNNFQIGDCVFTTDDRSGAKNFRIGYGPEYCEVRIAIEPEQPLE